MTFDFISVRDEIERLIERHHRLYRYIYPPESCDGCPKFGLGAPVVETTWDAEIKDCRRRADALWEQLQEHCNQPLQGDPR